MTRTVVRGVGLSGGGYLLTQVLTMATFLVLARLATPADFGELAAGMVLVNVGILVFGVESGMLHALVQRRDRLEEAAATAVVSTFVAGVAFTGVAYAVSPLVAGFFDSDRIGDVAAATSGLMLLRTLPVVPMALLQRRFSWVRRIVVEPVGAAVFGITAVIATANGMGVWGLVLGYYAQFSLDALLSWALVRWRPDLRQASLGMWRELISYARHIFAATAVQRVGDQIPQVLLGRYAGAGQLGQFRYGIRMASTPFAAIVAAASYVVFPALARIAEDRERFRAAFVRSLGWVAAIGMPCGLIMLGLGRPAAELIFGDVWSDAGEAAMALCLFPASGAIVSIVTEGFSAEGSPRWVARVHVVEVVVGAAAMVALLGWGLVGVSAGVSIGVTAGAAYALFRVARLLELPARVIAREIGPPLVAAVTMGLSVLALDRWLIDAGGHATVPGLALLVAEGLVAVGVYVALLHLMAPGRIGELRGLIREGRSAADQLPEGALEPAPPAGVDTEVNP